MSESAFDVLTGFAEKARLSATPLPSAGDTQAHMTGLGFNLLDQRFVASMDEVSELMRVPQVTRIPGVKNFVIGVINVRGRLMTVIDLALVFGEASSLPRAQRRVLAVEDEENLMGFMIDESLGMQQLPSDAYSETAPEVPDVFASLVDGAYVVAGTTWPLIRLRQLLSDPRLEKLALT